MNLNNEYFYDICAEKDICKKIWEEKYLLNIELNQEH